MCALLLEAPAENPFLARFYDDRAGYAFQTQLRFLFQRERQFRAIAQPSMFAQTTVSDYLFDKDKIFAYLNLDDNELFIYQRLYDLLSKDVPLPDLVIYLQAPTDVLIRRLRDRVRGLPLGPLRAGLGLPERAVGASARSDGRH